MHSKLAYGICLAVCLSLTARGEDSEAQKAQRSLVEDLTGAMHAYAKSDPDSSPKADADLKALTAAIINQKTRRHAVYCFLPFGKDDSAVRTIKEMLQDEDPYAVLNAALVLAAWGHKDGLEVLKKTALGNFAVSQSEYERDEAGLALLALSEKLPEGFKWVRNPLEK